MKHLFIIGFTLLATLSHSQTTPTKKKLNIDSIMRVEDEKRNQWIGKIYPNFLVTLQNEEYSNPKLKGKVIFVNFWFSTCVPCLAEMEDLNRLFAKFGSNPNFEFLSFTFENAEQIEKIRKQYNIHYKIFSIPKEECYRLNLRGGFPTNIVIDRNGLIKYKSQIGEADNFIQSIYTFISSSL